MHLGRSAIAGSLALGIAGSVAAQEPQPKSGYKNAPVYFGSDYPVEQLLPALGNLGDGWDVLGAETQYREGVGTVATGGYLGPIGSRPIVLVVNLDSRDGLTDEGWHGMTNFAIDFLAFPTEPEFVSPPGAYAPDACVRWVSSRVTDPVFGDAMSWGVSQCATHGDLVVLAISSGRVLGNTDVRGATEASNVVLYQAGIVE